MDIRVNNCIVEKKISWIAFEYRKPKVREALYLVIFSGSSKNIKYDLTVTTAFYDEEGWFLEGVGDIEELKVHYYADVPFPEEPK